MSVPEEIFAQIRRRLRDVIDAHPQDSKMNGESGLYLALKPVFLDVELMKNYILHHLNAGTIATMATDCLKKDFVLPTSFQLNTNLSTIPAQFSFLSRFRNRSAQTETGLRKMGSHPLTRKEYMAAIAKAPANPLIIRTAALMSDIVVNYLTGLNICIDKTDFSKTDKSNVINLIAISKRAAATTFIEELLPYLLQAEPSEPDDIRSRFMAGFVQAVNDQAFKVEKFVKELACPFTSGTGKLWSSDFVQDGHGRWHLNPRPKAAAFPVLLHGFLTHPTLFADVRQVPEASGLRLNTP